MAPKTKKIKKKKETKEENEKKGRMEKAGKDRNIIKCRGSWNGKQKAVMLKFLKNHIKNKISPKKDECVKLQREHPDLFKEKKWVQIKVFIHL